MNDLKRVSIEEGFWKEKLALIENEVLPFQWEALNDRVEGAAPSCCIENFRTAARMLNAENGGDGAEPGAFHGCYWQDSDLYKWIEAAAYTLCANRNEELEKLVDEAVELICAAQDESGYLDTHYLINGMEKSFTNLRDCHELYCFGHLAEGAAAYFRATGKDRLLRAAMRFADCIGSRFGAEEGKLRGYPGHEEAELALVKLYELTGEKKYLDLASYFIDERGRQPYYFDKERGIESAPGEVNRSYEYSQAHVPVREQEEAVGHAVRAVYLYSGMADVARHTGDEALKAACLRLWKSITRKKMYLTAGIGATAHGEAFLPDYCLPNDTAYAETCAAVGLVFFAKRMFELDPSSEYADIMERCLYNGVLSGMALDGKSFFYVNPLEVDPAACRADLDLAHVLPVRPKWFGCACCPPNVARLLGSLGDYLYTQKEDTVFLHLYISSQLRLSVGGSEVSIRIRSELPWQGKVSLCVNAETPARFTMALRVPDWCGGRWEISCPEKIAREENGYLYLTGEWSGEEIALSLETAPRLVRANPLVRADIGKAALMRGPLVYCAEEADNGKNLPLLSFGEDSRFQEETVRIGGCELLAVTAEGSRILPEESGLYTTNLAYRQEACRLRLIPYFAWANRGEGEMAVWFRCEGVR